MPKTTKNREIWVLVTTTMANIFQIFDLNNQAEKKVAHDSRRFSHGSGMMKSSVLYWRTFVLNRVLLNVL